MILQTKIMYTVLVGMVLFSCQRMYENTTRFDDGVIFVRVLIRKLRIVLFSSSSVDENYTTCANGVIFVFKC
jgi:hypothetical protein